MIQRKTIPAQGKDGKWSAVATIQQPTPTGLRNIDLPVSDPAAVSFWCCSMAA